MGICASSQYTRKDGMALHRPSTAKIIDLDGKLQEFRQPIKAGHILSQNPDCFLWSSESMYINCHVPLMPQNEELQLGQIYFLMPLSKSQTPLSLQDLCALAIKAHAALAHSDRGGYSSSMKTSKLSNRSYDVTVPPRLLASARAPQGCLKTAA